MDDEINNGFTKLAHYRDQLATAMDPNVRASLHALIRETEDRLAELRREAYGPLARS